MDMKIGFIGLGNMGKWMALNLKQSSFDVTVFDIDAQAVRFLTDQGATFCPNPAEMAEQTDCVYLCLTTPETIENTIFAEKGLIHGAKPGFIVVDSGTTNYFRTVEIAKRLQKHGIYFADAPVTGRPERAKEGTLTIMFGGDESVFNQTQPALNAIGSEVVYMGDVGNGQLTKMINNTLMSINTAALAEIMPLAVKLGLDSEKTLQVITRGSARSWAAEYWMPLALEGRFDQGYPLNSDYKVLASIAEISSSQKIPLPLVHAAITIYQMAIADGYGEESKASMVKVFERIFGVSVSKKIES